MKHVLESPFYKEKLKSLNVGDKVYLTGIVYTARDAAHKRMTEMIKNGEKPPFDIKDCAIYYVGPTPAKEGFAIGSAGPTTSYRMDAYAPMLLDMGQSIMIGKGQRSKEVIKATERNGAVYLAAIGGAGALMAEHIVKSEIIAFEDLGAEAVRRIYVKNIPLTVVLDSRGNDLYVSGREEYLNSLVK